MLEDPEFPAVRLRGGGGVERSRARNRWFTGKLENVIRNSCENSNRKILRAINLEIKLSGWS